jgi:hypothetical protein
MADEDCPTACKMLRCCCASPTDLPEPLTYENRSKSLCQAEGAHSGTLPL